MLPAAHRLRRSADFGRTVRQGVRAGRSTMVVHMLADDASSDSAMVGFVVSKAVGNAVVRNRVERRLRGAMTQRVTQLEPGVRVVVRALPASAQASYDMLEHDLDAGLRRAGSRVRSREHTR